MRALIPLLLLAACATSTTLNSRYVGITTPNVPSEICKTSRSILQFHDGQAPFIPDKATWSLPGTVSPAGTLQAERIGQGANKKPYLTRFTGTWTTQNVAGTYTTPRCTYTVQLARN